MTSNSVKRLKIHEEKFVAINEPKSNLSDPEMCWNHEMKVFYNNSWGGESDIKTIGESTQWTDFPQAMEKKRKCHMCGGSGHEANACPNACCLTVRNSHFSQIIQCKKLFYPLVRRKN